MRSIRRNARRAAATAVASGLLAAGALALTTAAVGASTIGSHQGGTAYSFRTIDNPNDVTFNQLLGINNWAEMAGYFGSGAQGHPNKGYVIPPFSSHFVNENFPGSVQTQVTGLNNRGVTVGFWSSMNNANLVNDNFGFVDVNGHFRNADFPAGSPATPPTTRARWPASTPTRPAPPTGSSRRTTGTSPTWPSPARPRPWRSASTTATRSWASTASDRAARPSCTASPGPPQHGFRTVDDPHGFGTITINGVNDRGQLVGFYVDSIGNTDGFAATPLP